MVNKQPEHRIENDFLGEVSIPINSYWGANTARAKEQLFSCGMAFHPRQIQAMALIKKASALVNSEDQHIKPEIALAIVSACDEVLAGRFHEQFIAEPFQSGGGIAFTFNVNEIIANRAEELLGGSLGEYKSVKPYEHVQLGQSLNDTFPAAMRVATLLSLQECEPVLLDCERQLRRKSVEFAKVLTIGRAHLRDAAPTTLGAEFNAFACTIERCYKQLVESSKDLWELSMAAEKGSTANTGNNHRILERLAQLTGLPLQIADNASFLNQSMSDFVQVSSSIKQMSLELSKIANDLRLLNSGPTAGLAEISLTSESVSSSTPNTLASHLSPSLTESLNMVAFQIMGNDLAIAFAAQAGQLQLNAMTPLVAHTILQSLDLLRFAVTAFNQKYLVGILANTERCQSYFAASNALVTVLGQHIGVSSAQQLFAQCQGNLQSIKHKLKESKILSSEMIDKIIETMDQGYITGQAP